MRIEHILEQVVVATYEVGDIVQTPYGPGLLVKELGQDEANTYYRVILSKEARIEHGLKDRPYKMSSSEFSGVVKKGNQNV